MHQLNMRWSFAWSVAWSIAWSVASMSFVLTSCNSPGDPSMNAASNTGSSADTTGNSSGNGSTAGSRTGPGSGSPPRPGSNSPVPMISAAPTVIPYPTVHGQDFHGQKNFAYLINNYTQGKSEPIPWAGYWWPYTANGIAAYSMGGSPAGKYDAARGNQTHAQSWEIRYHGAGVPRVQQWWGHCNGWCAAAALFPEPHDSVMVNGINFGIGDIKALLSEAGMAAAADFYGERLDVDDPNSPKYWDTVPDQYFLVLTNYIGNLKKAVLIDRYTGAQVWNQPLAGYKFEYPTPADYLGSSSDAPHVYKILVTSTIWWLNDGVAADVQTHDFNFEDDDPTGIIQSRVLKMEVWLDGPVVFDNSGKITSSGDVIVTRQGDYLAGGAWRMGDGYLVDAWPDYMWIPYSIDTPTDPDEDYANPEVDIKWLKKHILVNGGNDDLSVTPGSIQPAPRPSLPTPIFTNTTGTWPYSFYPYPGGGSYPGGSHTYPGGTSPGSSYPGYPGYPGGTTPYPVPTGIYNPSSNYPGGITTPLPGTSTTSDNSNYPGSVPVSTGSTTHDPGWMTYYPGGTTNYPGNMTNYPGSTNTYPSTSNPNSSTPNNSTPNGSTYSSFPHGSDNTDWPTDSSITFSWNFPGSGGEHWVFSNHSPHHAPSYEEGSGWESHDT